MIETILTCVKDQYKGLQAHKGKTALVFCTAYFLLGLPLTTDAGTFIMSLLDNYGVGTAAFLYGILEVVGIFWIYGLKNFCLDVQFMLGSPVSIIWRSTWLVITPLVLIVIFIYGNVLIFQTHADESTEIPFWGTGIGWGLAGIALIQIPIWFVIGVFRQKGPSLSQKFIQSFRATNDYGPIDDKIYQDWHQWKMEQSAGFRDIDTLESSAYQKNKTNLFAAMSDAKKGSDNPGFVPDNAPPPDHVLSFNNTSHSLEGKDSFRKPRLLSKRNFDDNY